MTSYAEKGYEIYEGTTYSRDKRRKDSLLTTEYKNAARDNNDIATSNKNKAISYEPAAVYEGSTYIPRQVTYKSPQKVKKESENTSNNNEIAVQKEEQFEQISEASLKGQLEAYRRNNAASVWKLLSSGDLAVGSESKTRAKADVSEDGYWGAKHTSERLFDFAKTMSGGNTDIMKNMRSKMDMAVESVTKEWGSELPGLCQETIQNTRKLFTEYLALKGEIIS